LNSGSQQTGQRVCSFHLVYSIPSHRIAFILFFFCPMPVWITGTPFPFFFAPEGRTATRNIRKTSNTKRGNKITLRSGKCRERPLGCRRSPFSSFLSFISRSCTSPFTLISFPASFFHPFLSSVPFPSPTFLSPRVCLSFFCRRIRGKPGHTAELNEDL